MSLLVVDRVTGGYGGADVLHDVSLDVGSGEIVVIVGPNGAGKSTAMKAVLGLVAIRAGAIAFAGAPIAGLSTVEIVRLGIGFVPQTENVFATLSVEENLEMGAFLREHEREVEAQKARVFGLFPALEAKRRQPAGALSGGQRQMVAIGRALMLEPRLLLLDEPTAGLAPRVIGEIFDLVRAVRATGVAVLMVEQNAKPALAVADRGYVLATGRNRHEGPARALLDDPEVAELFLGG